MEGSIFDGFSFDGGSGGAEKAGRVAYALLRVIQLADLVFNFIAFPFLYFTCFHTSTFSSGPTHRHSPPDVSESAGYPPSSGGNSLCGLNLISNSLQIVLKQ